MLYLFLYKDLCLSLPELDMLWKKTDCWLKDGSERERGLLIHFHPYIFANNCVDNFRMVETLLFSVASTSNIQLLCHSVLS